MAPIRSILASFFVLAVSTSVLSAEESRKPPSSMWREAPQADGDSELDRLSRAFVRLADTGRPAIVQIRVADTNPSSSRGDGQQLQGSVGGVAHKNQLPARTPSPDLGDHLAGAIGERLGGAAFLFVITARGGQHG